MTPASLIPTPDTIPVPSGWFEILLIVTFVLHVLLMNVIVGWSVIAFCKSLSPAPANTPVIRDMGKKLPTCTALTVNFGVAPLLFVQVLYGQFIYSSSVIIAWWWLAVIGLVMAAYYAFYWHTLRFDALAGGRTFVLGLAALLLLITGFIYVNNMTLMLRPDRWAAYFAAPGGTLLNLGEPTLLPRWLHFMCSAVAVGGLFLAWLWTRRANRGEAEPAAAAVQIASGMRWFTLATMLNVLFGLWFLLSMPRAIMLLLMGGSSVATVLFILGLAGTAAALFFGARQRVLPTAVSLVFILLTMIGLRDVVRRAYLSPYFGTADLTVTNEYGSLVLFLATFALGIGLIVYMLKLAARAGQTKPTYTGEEN